MSEQIEVDEQVLEFLKAEAEPFVDTPNSVLRRLLGLDGSAGSRRGGQGASKRSKGRVRSRRKPVNKKKTRAVAGTLLPLPEYGVPILVVLEKHGGRAPSREVIEEVGEILGDRLTKEDNELLESGGKRWKNRTQFARLRLVHAGYMQKESPRGVWEISEEGRAALHEVGQQGKLSARLF